MLKRSLSLSLSLSSCLWLILVFGVSGISVRAQRPSVCVRSLWSATFHLRYDRLEILCSWGKSSFLRFSFLFFSQKNVGTTAFCFVVFAILRCFHRLCMIDGNNCAKNITYVPYEQRIAGVCHREREREKTKITLRYIPTVYCDSHFFPTLFFVEL